MSDTFQHETIRAVSRRLIPYLCLAYFVSFLDRVNVGFAAVTMNVDLGLSATMYGFGTGVFFVGYVLFEIPSNLALRHFGAPFWLGRIMISWGLVSGAMTFAWSPESFYVLRFLLGAAEAGFFPGVVLYLTYWFPSSYRARITSLFMVAIALSGVIGAPVSGFILALDGAWGLKGWQWLFLVEAAPAVVMGFVTFWYLTDRPARANWLRPAQREWLSQLIDREERLRARSHGSAFGIAVRDPGVWALGLVNFGLLVGLYGISFWFPQIVNGAGIRNPIAIGFLSALPPLFGAVGMVLWSRHSDRSEERVRHLALSALVGAGGFAASALVADPVLSIGFLLIAALGIYASLPLFWTLPTAFLSGAGAAGGLALINSISNLGGYVGPQLLGLIKDRSQSFAPGFLAIAGFVAFAAIVALIIGLTHKAFSAARPAAAEPESPPA